MLLKLMKCLCRLSLKVAGIASREDKDFPCSDASIKSKFKLVLSRFSSSASRVMGFVPSHKATSKE